MKIKIFRIIMTIALICTLFTIYRFSSQNGTQSKGISTKVSRFILNFSNTYKEANAKEQRRMLDRTNAIIRKIAQFSIYTLLGLTIMGLMTKTKLPSSY